jgi:Flp pilus assembly protein TadD
VADVAPEDQGGDVKAVDVSELPARKKATGLTQKAIARLRDGDYANAEPLLVRAVLIDPSYADAWRHLGIARAQLADKDGARRAYRKYLQLAPAAPDAAQVRKILAAP